MNIAIFDDEYSEKGQYFIDEQNMVWLHGTILCDRLGFKNPSEAITKHTDEDERRKEDLNGRLVWFVSEPGVWGMILAAKTPEALKFKRHLKHKILPKIRASRYYIAPNATSSDLEAAKSEITVLENKLILADKNIHTLQATLYSDTVYSILCAYARRDIIPFDHIENVLKFISNGLNVYMSSENGGSDRWSKFEDLLDSNYLTLLYPHGQYALDLYKEMFPDRIDAYGKPDLNFAHGFVKNHLFYNTQAMKKFYIPLFVRAYKICQYETEYPRITTVKKLLRTRTPQYIQGCAEHFNHNDSLAKLGEVPFDIYRFLKGILGLHKYYNG
jgi:prophage antirepressor-like protein